MSLHILVNKSSRDFYYLDHPFDKEVNENIKKLEKKELIAIPSGKKGWKLDALNLYNLILLFKGRNDVFFEFVDSKEREVFIDKYKKALAKYKAKEDALNEVLDKQKRGIEIKSKLFTDEPLDFDYTLYLNEGIVPFRHQIIGALYTDIMDNCIIGADMGTGKSLLAILSTELNKSYQKILVIVPNSLKFNWVNELMKFINEKYYVLNEKKKSNNIYTPEESKYFIVNYEYFASKEFDFNKKIKQYGIELPDRVIIDESHRLKNPKANTTVNILSNFKENVPSWVLLTGTPAPSKLSELFTQLHVISPLEFTSKTKFYKDYCGMVYRPGDGYVEAEDFNLDKLTNKLDSLMFRVKKKDVLKDLPEIQINKVYLQLSDKEEKEYNEIEAGLKTINWDDTSVLFEKEEGADNSVMGILIKLRQYNSIVKIKNYITDFIEELNLEGNKVVTFDCFVDPLMQLTDHFKHNGKIYYGQVGDSKQKQDIVDLFQQDNDILQNIFITSQSGNYGINLTRSHNMVVLNKPYVPGQVDQMYSRIHRNGQLFPVTIYEFIIKGTIDEIVDSILTEKMKRLNKVIDKEEYVDKSQKSIFSDIFKVYKEKYKK